MPGPRKPRRLTRTRRGFRCLKARQSTQRSEREYQVCGIREVATIIGAGAIRPQNRVGGAVVGRLESERSRSQPPCFSILIALNLVSDLTLPDA
jgi:hypothetical protein